MVHSGQKDGTFWSSFPSCWHIPVSHNSPRALCRNLFTDGRRAGGVRDANQASAQAEPSAMVSKFRGEEGAQPAGSGVWIGGFVGGFTWVCACVLRF